ncbi:MAG: tol-pal system protein YbgF [Candidatus Binatia bacterium]
MKWLFAISFLLGGLVLSACVGPQELAVIEREQKRLRRQNTKIRAENKVIREELDNVRSRLADTRATLEEMQTEQGALKEKVEEVRHQIGRQIGQSSRQEDLRIRELDARIASIDDELKAQGTLLKAREQQLEVLREAVLRVTRGKGVTVALGGRETGAKRTRGKSVLAGEPEAVRLDYEKGWKLLEQKDYRGAIARFKKFLIKHPKSAYADNAQYWIGESYYALKEFDQAILEFDAVRRKYPSGDKVPAALLKQGFAFAELGDKVDARLILQELIARYPESQEAVKAKQKVKTLES